MSQARHCSNPNCLLQVTYVASVPDIFCPRCRWAWQPFIKLTPDDAAPAQQNWDDVPWTPFIEGELPQASDAITRLTHEKLVGVAINSRYQVYVYDGGSGAFGRLVWLSIKTHDRSARHDWRDLQRIKNEVVGPEYDAVEIFPAEDKLVDTSNQYHLWVFLDFKIPFGFGERAVGDGSYNGSVQRPFSADARPADCIPLEQYRAMVDKAAAEMVAKKNGNNN